MSKNLLQLKNPRLFEGPGFSLRIKSFRDYDSLTSYTGPVPLGLDRLGVCRDNCDVCLRVFIAYDFIYPFLFLIYIPKVGKVSVIKKFFRKKLLGKSWHVYFNQFNQLSFTFFSYIANLNKNSQVKNFLKPILDQLREHELFFQM